MTSGRPSEIEGDGPPPHGLEYFYAPPAAFGARTVRIEGDEFTHLTHVMRRSEGDVIGVADGEGRACVTVITLIEKRAAVCTIQSTHLMLHEPPVRVTLAAALLKNPSRFDFLIEKATELGVRAIIPLITERTIPRHARVDRWQKLALAAMKQSGRCILPAVHEPLALTDLLARAPVTGERWWMLHEDASGAVPADVVDDAGPGHLLLIGPEGGFTDAEVGMAQRQGCAAVRLGTRRLRSETAAMAAAARFLV